jgi:hypothetical protein
MEYLMKAILTGGVLAVLLMQTAGDFAIHEGREKMWHFWKGVSLLLLGLLPITLWLMQESVILMDYACLLLVYASYRWLFFDILMNEKLEMNIDYIGNTAFYERFLKRFFPNQNPVGYLWIRFTAFWAWNLVWWLRWVPGEYFKPITGG